VQEFYTDFYAATEHSRAHAEFCERVFGANLCQHGFADMAQIKRRNASFARGSGHSLSIKRHRFVPLPIKHHRFAPLIRR
jgi:hypothetical protein